MENNIKTTNSRNMNKFSFNSTINIPIDSNANIKSILNLETYIFDQKVECGNGKAIISGKVGVKVCYLDTDNMTNTLNESQTFSETYIESSLTSDTILNINNSTIIANLLSTEPSLKISCDINFTPIAYVNLSLNNQIEENANLITRKNAVSTNTISQNVSTSFENISTLETKDKINKILCNSCYFTPEKTVAENGYFTVEGKVCCYVLFETSTDDSYLIKEISNTTPVKLDIELNNLNKEQCLDFSYCLDKSKTEISTDMDDDINVISIKNIIKVCGVVLDCVSVEIVDDIYSTVSEIESSTSSRDIMTKVENYTLTELISNEINLSNSEPAIDEIVANLNAEAETTNTYIKDETIFVEGIISSNLIYVDENKEIKNKTLEVPFVINSKINAKTINCVHNEISIIDFKIKVKRGTIIELDYSMFLNLCVYEKQNINLVDSYKFGKPVDFSKYDYQIFIAKPNETLWELCKRIKISLNDINQYNKNLPPVFTGGEKIMIKR